MKTNRHHLVRSILVALFVAGCAGGNMAYAHDDYSSYDSQHHRHVFVHHNGHRGYWERNDRGALVFVTL
jgi:outer membrane lipoprotein SlyB